jgi:MoxR-like ATPase
MRRPLLLEGEPGVGKTEVGRTLARVLGTDLIRLQCYEGIDAGQALYEWDYARRLLYARLLQSDEVDPDTTVDQLYGPRFLQERPLLAAVRAGSRAVLLVDELDRADDEFEAFLLEALSDSSITIPEIGRVGSADGTRPAVIITSNRTRELHDALKRRCLYHWIDYPDPAREAAIIHLRVPSASDRLARSVATAVARLRGMGPDQASRRRRGDRLGRGAGGARARRAHGGRRARHPRLVKTREDLQAVEARVAELLG